MARSDGLHWFVLEGVHSNKPSCAANQNYWMIKNENSQAGKTQISMLIAAHSAGRSVAVDGANSCTRWGDGEDADTITALP